MENEQEKIELLRSIDNKMDRMVDLLGQLVGFQVKSLIPQMHQNTMHAANYRPAIQPICFHHYRLNHIHEC